MKSEQIKQITSKAIEELVWRRQRRAQRIFDGLSRGNGQIPPLQFCQRYAYRASLPTRNARGRVSNMEILRTLRQEGRKRNHDPCPSLSSPHERKQ